MNSPIPLGIDIAKLKFDAALRLSDGRWVQQAFPNTPEGFQTLQQWWQQHASGPVHVALEATGRYGDRLALWLYQHQVCLSLLNPARVKAFARSRAERNKTDRVDARTLAAFVASHHPRSWQPRAEKFNQLQALVRRREQVQQLLQQESNRLEEVPAIVEGSVRQVMALLKKQIQALEQRLETHFEMHEDLAEKQRLLCSIPGIGPVSSTKLLAELPVEQLQDSRQASAWVGVCPQRRESGSSVRRRGRMSKEGRGDLRRALYMPALVAMRHNPVLKVFAERLLAHGKSKKAVAGAVMHKLLRICFAVLKHSCRFDPHHAMA
ncbi:MAG: transposase [Verrucomicrobiia bacterium]